MFTFAIFPYLLIKISSINTSIRVLDKGLVPLEKKSVGIQFYIDIENEDKLHACKLHCYPKSCCLSDNETVDCKLKVYGDYLDVLKPKYRDTILFIYPTMFQHDQVGYCNFVLEYQCGARIHKREFVRVPFDTRVKSKFNSKELLKEYIDGRTITLCQSMDQDSLNQCAPVNCEAKYFGNRPFYDGDVDKCVKAAECLTNPQQELPDVVYIPTSNTCRDLNNPLTIADIYAISTGLGVNTDSPVIDEMKVTLESNCSTISQNLMLLRDMLYGKFYPEKSKTDYSKSCNAAIFSILTCVIGLSLALLIFVFFVNIIAWTHTKWRSGELKKIIQDIKKKIRSSKKKQCKKQRSQTNDEVKNKLLREVVVSQLPLELRDSVVDICDRINEEVRWKKRWMGDIGSKVNIQENYTSDTSTTSEINYEEKQRLLGK